MEAPDRMDEPFRPRAGGWRDQAQVDEYLHRIDALEPRRAAEAVLVDHLPDRPRRLLDLGAGDGRLAALVALACPALEEVVLVDSSRPMRARAKERFGGDGRVGIIDHDLANDITSFGRFDIVVSGFAIHHLSDQRKRSLYREVAKMLDAGGRFLNLDVVASATPELHRTFLDAIGRAEDDPEDQLAPVEDQLRWLRESGLDQVDCLWRWRGFALLVGSNG
jgi:SAM-dependent methyltransferase